MARFMIESPHTPQECMRAQDEELAMGSDVLAKFDWGCSAGEHKAWAVVETDSESSARNMVPETVRSKAHVVEVSKLTPEQIRKAHEK